jgi:hypothetical protein
MSFPHSRQISGLTGSVIDQNLIRDRAQIQAGSRHRANQLRQPLYLANLQGWHFSFPWGFGFPHRWLCHPLGQVKSSATAGNTPEKSAGPKPRALRAVIDKTNTRDASLPIVGRLGRAYEGQ